jgi:carbamoyltransferase
MSRTNEVILGIGGYTADASATLLVDGELVGAIEEERFTREKHQGGWPERAIDFLLRTAKLKLADVSHATFSYNPWLRLSYRLPDRLTKFPRYPMESAFLFGNEILTVGRFMRALKELEQKGPKVHALRHHMCHVSSAFFTSPFDEAALYSIDQRGEWDTTLWARGKGIDIEPLGATPYPHSLGIFYTGMTQHLGFATNDEYKVMGLASYGKPRIVDRLRRIVRLEKDGQFRLELKYFQHQNTQGLRKKSFFTDLFVDEFGPARKKGEPLTEHHKDLAASAQRVFEECAFHQLRHLHELTKVPNLGIAGGCGLNGVMNGRVYDETPFKHVYLPSVSGDDGLSLGGAYYARHQILKRPRGKPLLRADLGTSYSDAAIEEQLKLYKLSYRKVADIVPATVELLLAGKIIGWFQGRMEFGARALGNRSIVANPTLPTMKDKINKYVKFREEFRPFAPSVAEEAASRYFKVRDPIPFMTVVVDVTPEGAERLPATTHVDGTARVQTVNRDEMPLYWRLISEFGKATGTPVVLNTSFNVMGEPIVESPDQAIRCFFSCGLDALAIGNFVLEKTQNGE